MKLDFEGHVRQLSIQELLSALNIGLTHAEFAAQSADPNIRSVSSQKAMQAYRYACRRLLLCCPAMSERLEIDEKIGLLAYRLGRLTNSRDQVS